MKTYYYIDSMGHIKSTEAEGYELSYKLRKMMGNCFESPLEAEAYVDYLLAREVIKEDTKGFKPNWNNLEQIRFYGHWDVQFKIPFRSVSFTQKNATIYFKTVEDIEESFKEHPNEWKTYLTYKQY